MTQTVSHELRNPLNSIIMQQDSQHVYMKQMKEILADKNLQNNLQECKKKIVTIFDDMWESCKISKTSSKLMLYNVEDLLDYGQMESGNFRKNI